MKVIIVTGSVCTGKTTIAKKIAKFLKARYIDVNNIIRKENLSEGYDRKRKCKIVDEKKLVKSLVKLIKNSKEDLVIDSHLSHYLPSKYVDLCIVTTCDLKRLKKRLEKRGYDRNKVRENLDAEIFEVCLSEAKEVGHNIQVVDTSKKENVKRLCTLIG